MGSYLNSSSFLTQANKMHQDWPDTYYAAIFTSQRADTEYELYAHTSEQMITLAQKQPGFLGVESVREEDGLGITVSYWTDRQAIKAWGEVAEHRVAMQLGRIEFYSWFQLRIARVETERSFGLDRLADDAEDTISTSPART